MLLLIDASLYSKPSKKNSLLQFFTTGVNIESYQAKFLYNSSKNTEFIIPEPSYRTYFRTSLNIFPPYYSPLV